MSLQIFNRTIKVYLDRVNETTTRENKIKNAECMMDYIVENKNIFDTDLYKKFRVTIFEKLLEFKESGFDSDKYISLLFPNGYSIKNMVNPIDDKQLEQSDPVTETKDEQIKQSQSVIKTNDEQLKQPDSAIPQKTIVSDTMVVKLLFEYHATNLFSQFNYNLNFTDSIINHVGTYFETFDTTLIPNLLNNTKSIDVIKNDVTIPDGPFLIKLNEYSYDLYEKKTEIIVSKGYFYNGTTKNYVIEKIGRYGILL